MDPRGMMDPSRPIGPGGALVAGNGGSADHKLLTSTNTVSNNGGTIIVENTRLSGQKPVGNAMYSVGGKSPLEEDEELNIDHITSMVDRLGEDSDDDDMIRQHQQRAMRKNEQESNLDPSIVFAKKAEPGKRIDGLQDWIYRDPQGEIQGMWYYSL